MRPLSNLRCLANLIVAAFLALGVGEAAMAQAQPGGAQGPVAPAAPDPATYPHRIFPGGVVGLMGVAYAQPRGFRPLTLDLYLPPGRAAPKALVLWIHGGAWAVGDPRGGGISTPAYKDWPAVLAGVAARGYIVAGVSYRLSGEARFPAAIFDIKAAVRWLRANAALYGIDPNRVVAWGGSAGGQLATLLGTSCGVADLEGPIVPGAAGSSCVQGTIDFYGPTDFSQIDRELIAGSMPHNQPDGAESAYLGCNLADCPAAVVQRANPITYVDRTDPPFLIVHGDADTRVPLGQSRLLYEALTAAGVKAELMIVPGVNHIFAGATDAQGAAIMARVMAFLDRTTGTRPPP